MRCYREAQELREASLTGLCASVIWRRPFKFFGGYKTLIKRYVLEF